jgi:hypothetical protein
MMVLEEIKENIPFVILMKINYENLISKEAKYFCFNDDEFVSFDDYKLLNFSFICSTKLFGY